MVTISTLSTPIATKLVNKDGTINHVWNEFFVRLMTTAGITVSINALEAETESLQTQIDNLDIETSAAITMSDSDSNPSATLAKLYDGNRESDGVSYTVSGTDKYIQYKFGVEDYVDRIAIWTADANGRVYIGYSTDESSWSYLSGESDHTLDSAGKLVTATSQANAKLNYWQLEAGQNNALFPNNIVAKYIRLYITGTYTTEIYELVPARILIAEMAAIKNLAAISAFFGGETGFTTIIGDGISVFSSTITVESGVNDKLDWKEDSVTEVATLTASTTYTPTTLAAHVQTKMRAEGDSNTTVTYSVATKKITIANSTLTTLDLLWATGANSTTNCGPVLGFDISTDDSGALTYEADSSIAERVRMGAIN